MEEKNETQIIKNGIYRHFKGDYYIVLDIAYSSIDMSKWVVYRALYGENKLYIRKIEDFLSKVDKQKYKNVKQEYRFTYQSIESQKEKFKGE